MKNTKNERVFVEYPKGGQQIDVTAFLNLLSNDLTDLDESREQKVKEIDETIRFLNLHMSPTDEDNFRTKEKEMFRVLYELKDLFTNTNVFKK